MSMAVMRIHKTANYTIMANYHFKQKEMSLKAKGLLSLMLSLPDEWDYSIAGLVKLSKDGKDSVMSALKELEKFGYLVRTRKQDESGKFIGYDYDIWETPEDSFLPPYSEKPYAENPNTDKPNTENPRQLNNKRINDEGINSSKNKDKKDIGDKRKSEDFPDADAITNEKPNSFSKELIRAGYIESDDLFMNMYNHLFSELCNERGFEMVRSCLWYFIKNLRFYGGNVVDANGVAIESKHAYLKASLMDGLEQLERMEERNKKLEEWFTDEGALRYFEDHHMKAEEFADGEDDDEMPY